MNHQLRLCLIGVFATALICAVPGAATTRHVSARNTATDYSQYVGKYPSDMFKKEPTLKTKLRTLLGTSYQAFFDRMQTQVPIEKDGEAIVARGCAAHECTVEEAILVIQNGTLYVALRMESKFSKTFPADRSKLPEALKRAMEQ
jgi:hypothetical protein